LGYFWSMGLSWIITDIQMQQQTTLMRFLLIGISSILLLMANRCATKPVVPTIITSNFVYINKTSKSIEMTIYDRELSFYRNELVFESFLIGSTDSISFQMKGEGIFPFYLPNEGSISGDSAIIKMTNKCIVNYTEFERIRDGIGIFHFPNYDNFSKELINQPNPTFYYTFSEKDFDEALECE